MSILNYIYITIFRLCLSGYDMVETIKKVFKIAVTGGPDPARVLFATD